MVDDSEGLHRILVGDQVSLDTFPITRALPEVPVDCCSHSLGVAEAGNDVVHLLQAVGHAVFDTQDGS